MRLSRLGRLGLCRLGLGGLLPLHRLMVPDRTPRGRPKHGMMPRHVPCHAAHGGASDASGMGNPRRERRYQEGQSKQNAHVLSSKGDTHPNAPRRPRCPSR